MTEPLKSKEASKPRTRGNYLEEDAPVRERAIEHVLIPQRAFTPDGYMTDLADRAKPPVPPQAPKPPLPLEKALARAASVPVIVAAARYANIRIYRETVAGTAGLCLELVMRR